MAIEWRDFLVFEALAASHLPQVAVFPPAFAAPILELRTYAVRSAAHLHALEPIFQRSGIRPVHCTETEEGATYFIPFASLAARERAWTNFANDLDWMRVRQCADVIQISLWKVRAS